MIMTIACTFDQSRAEKKNRINLARSPQFVMKEISFGTLSPPKSLNRITPVIEGKLNIYASIKLHAVILIKTISIPRLERN